MTEQEKSFIQQVSENDRQLAIAVSHAYFHRKVVGFVEVSPGEVESTEILRSAENVRATIAQSPEDTILTSAPIFGSHEVVTTNAHDYIRLVSLAIDKVPGEPAEGKYAKMKEILDHEFAHHAVALNEPGVTQIYYGIAFTENRETGQVFYQPFIRPIGKISVSSLQRIIQAPQRLSPSDRGQLPQQ